MKQIFVMALVAIVGVAATAQAQERSKAPEDAKVYIIWPRDGQVIKGGEFWLRMGLRNFGVTPAGVKHSDAGHHHVVIDAELPALDEPIPLSDNYRHFGAGQSEARISLQPGTHTLQLLVGDHNHIPHDPPIVSQKVTITVPEE